MSRAIRTAVHSHSGRGAGSNAYAVAGSPEGFAEAIALRAFAIPGQPVTVVGNPWARNENAPVGTEAQMLSRHFMRIVLTDAVGRNA